MVGSLKASFDEREVSKGGTRPHETRFVSPEALSRMINRYRAYMNHLVKLTRAKQLLS